jgi:hypothetical protein
MRAAVPSLMLICILNGCTTTTGSSATDTPVGLADAGSLACGAFQPITWSTRDTDQTIRQVKAHNASFVAVCSPKGKK